MAAPSTSAAPCWGVYDEAAAAHAATATTPAPAPAPRELKAKVTPLLSPCESLLLYNFLKLC